MTGKSITFPLLDKIVTFYNQRSRDWTHPYPYQNNDRTLTTSGCGIFTLCHCIEWLTGEAQSPEKWADFSVATGGRGEDGTDRPVLLHELMAHGEAQLHGFRYDEDGLLNDLETLYTFLSEQQGVAMCNLRPGHIVAIVAAREVDHVKQVLAIDSFCESMSEKVRDAVCEVIPGSEITFTQRNANGLPVGECTSYGAFWVELTKVCDYNLLHRI